MAISIKSNREIELMRESGRILSEVLLELEDYIKPGISTLDIDTKCRRLIESHNCIPSFLGYNGFPASVCTSVNDQVVHGIPNEEMLIDEGDIISLDVGVIYQGYHSDAARTFPIGEISEEAKKLIKVTRESFFKGIEYAKEGNRLFDISKAIQEHVEKNGFSVVRDLVGHGIGKNLHEDPQIPNFKQKMRGPRLEAGMTLAIEPMVNVGHYDVAWLDDDWTVVTRDGSLSAHYENTVLITKDQAEILTLKM